MEPAPGQIWEVVLRDKNRQVGDYRLQIGDKLIIDSMFKSNPNWDLTIWWFVYSDGVRGRATTDELLTYCQRIDHELPDHQD